MSKASEKRAETLDAVKSLRKMLRPGDTVYTRVDSVSRSGMSRNISAFIGRGRDVINITYLVSKVIGWSLSNRGSLKVSGCGMDMGFHVVYTLSRILFPKGFKHIAKRYCPSNDHFNRENREHHPDGGYALRHSWL